MDGVAALLAQRSVGEVLIEFGPHGVVRLREAGSSKIRLPKASREAILINTSGGLAGGDRIAASITLQPQAQLTVTTQAAERVYRSIGPDAEVDLRLSVGSGAALHWLPQETIQFEESRFARRITVELAADAELLMAESFVLGRVAMGEQMARVAIRDSWDVFRENRLLHAERFGLGPSPPRGKAALGPAVAFATVLLVALDTAQRAQSIADALDGIGALSCWNGKLLARLADEDGLKLKKTLARVIAAATGGKGVPRVWAL